MLKAAQSLWTSYCSVLLPTRRETLANVMRFSESCLCKSGRIPWKMDRIVTRTPPTWDNKTQKKYIYAPSGIWIHYLRVPAAEGSIPKPVFECVLSKQFHNFFERSHSDESTWSNNEQRWISVRCLALYGANRLVTVALHLVERIVLILPARWELRLPWCFYSLAQIYATTSGTTSTQADRDNTATDSYNSRTELCKCGLE
jgi:hypothetical protein